ncbi:MAG: hypothetical protein ACH346_00785 [Chthoniobacterales bacterium]
MKIPFFLTSPYFSLAAFSLLPLSSIVLRSSTLFPRRKELDISLKTAIARYKLGQYAQPQNDFSTSSRTFQVCFAILKIIFRAIPDADFLTPITVFKINNYSYLKKFKSLFCLSAAVCIFFIMTSVGITAPIATNEISSSSQNTADKDRARPIDLPAPVGEEMKGITIPQYDVDGRLAMKFFTELARKIDDHQVEMNQLKIEFFEKEGKDITVFVPHGVFDLTTKILSADSQATIKREDFEIVGQSAEFDTIKRCGTMKGHVHTDVRNGELPQEL